MIVSESSTVKYRSSERFLKLLGTIPSKDVPRAIVLLGILTEQLDPVDQDLDKHLSLAREEVTDVPAADVPEQTVKAVAWLLYEVRNSLDEEQKKTVGQLVSWTNLNTTENGPELEQAQTNDTLQKSVSSQSDLVEGEQIGKTNSESAKTSNPISTNEEDALEEQSGVPDDIGQETQSSSSTRSNSTSNGDLRCDFCSTTVPSKSDLISHSIRCDERPESARTECEHCGNTYISKQALSEHLKSCGASDYSITHTCDDCGEEFKSNSKLLEHRHSCTTTQSKSVSHTQSTSRKTTIEQNVTGVVVHYNSEDGYGFISSPGINSIELDKSEDIFFHVSEYPDKTPEESQRLRFDIKQSDEGFKAVNLRYTGPSQTEPWDDTFASKRPRWGKDS